MKKALACLAALCICAAFSLAAADENGVILSAVSQLETLCNDNVYLEKTGAGAMDELTQKHGEVSHIWRIDPDMEYLIDLLSPDKMTGEGQNQIIRRTFSGAAHLLCVKAGEECQSMTMSVCGEKTDSDCIQLFVYESGAPVLVSRWNGGRYCYYTVTLISPKALPDECDEENLQELFGVFLPGSTVKKLK